MFTPASPADLLAEDWFSFLIHLGIIGFPFCSVFRIYKVVAPFGGLLPLQSFVAFVRFSDRIGSGAQGAQARAWRQRCVGAPAQPIPFLRAASAREARVWSSLPPSQLESPRRELWSCFSRRRAAPHDGPRFRATTMLYTAPPGAARFPGLFGDFYGMHFFVSLVLTARGSSD